ncbi:protein FLOURY 1-like [Phragmites australis]|uniref:protein FLOURY 1-like n=1 Tax=Phragmites australis TaxID=29695 RepID=UPI002D77A2E6|nr:protein FLOURY 1-like [Phragmites australis]
MSGKNPISGAGFLKPLAGVFPGCVPGAGAVLFLVGSALGFVAVLHASESEEVGGEWAAAARWAAALVGSVGAHHLLVVISLLFLATRVWRLGKRCDVVEGLVGNADSAVQALRVGGAVCAVCAVCGSKIQALKRGRRGVERARSNSSKGRADKPVSRSLAAELEQEVDKEEEDNAGEISDSEERNVQWLRMRLKEEKLLREVALEEVEKERRAAASAADEAMAKIACLRSEKALVEREARQFQEMMQQKQMYDRQVIESLQWVIMKSGMQCWETEASSDRAVSETSEDDRDSK